MTSNVIHLPDLDAAAGQSPNGHQPEPVSANSAKILPGPNHPMAVAEEVVRDHTREDGAFTLRWWRGEFYRWTGTHWSVEPESEINGWLYRKTQHATYLVKTQEGWEPREWAPTIGKIANLRQALGQGVIQISHSLDAPGWIHGGHRKMTVPVANGLLDVRTRRLHPHTPSYFNHFSLPYEYREDAPEPTRWLKFLRELWPEGDDGDGSIDLLQEWFGYVLSGDTRHQKIMLMVGPRRSGKGTILRVLTALLGQYNVANPTVSKLSGQFGLESLIGKPLAAIGDARFVGKDVGIVVERLLTISGEDPIDVERKHRDAWNGRLPTRFMILSNEMPRHADASAALASRFLILQTANSFLGKEDPDLFVNLREELAGILVWALDGLDRLTERRRFNPPPSSDDATYDLERQASPVTLFVEDECDLGPNHEILPLDLYAGYERVNSYGEPVRSGGYRDWCKLHGIDFVPTLEGFGSQLRAAFPEVRAVRRRAEGAHRPRHYVGVSLRVHR